MTDSELFSSWKPDADEDLIREIYEMLLRAWALGLAHSSSDRHDDDDFADFSYDFGSPYDDAVREAMRRMNCTPEQFEKLSADLRTQAFTIGRLSQIDMISKVKEAYVKQLKSSSVSVKEFIKNAMEITGKDIGYSQYFDLVFRTNLQKDYNAAKAFDIVNDPPQFLQFVGIEDERQSDICRARSGVILPATDPWWDDNWPPLHYNCRSTIREIMGSEAEEVARNLSAVKAENKAINARGEDYSPSPSTSFGKMPAKDNTFWATTVSQQNRIIEAGLQSDLNAFAEKNLAADFKVEKNGYVTLERTTGGIRYPEKLQKEKEFKLNLETAKVLADNGFFVEMNAPYEIKNNKSWDAWLNGVDRVEFKNPDSKSLTIRSLEKRILGGYDQAQTVVATLAGKSQIEPLKEMIKVSIPSKAKNRVIKQMFVILDGKMVQLSNKELLSPALADSKLDLLI